MIVYKEAIPDERDQKYEDKYESRLEDERARVQDAAKAQAENR